jgi:DNA repair exonuclease SbcCD nuclease subunit
MPENNAEENLEQPGFRLEFDPAHQATHGVITAVLTADNHLSSMTFAQYLRKREERRQQLRQAFQHATDFAVGQGVDLFIQAGDLFDTPNPDERDRSFVAERLAQLRQAGIRTFALGGLHDTPVDTHNPVWGTGSKLSEVAPAPQISYARLGALHYFAPFRAEAELHTPPHPSEPVTIEVRGIRLAICGLGVLADTEGNPLADALNRLPTDVREDIARATIKLLILHAPIEGLTTGSPQPGTRAQVSRASIANQSLFSTILAGYHHEYRRLRIGQCNIIVAGATQRLDFNDSDDDPGFVFLGLAEDGIRWCSHIAVDSAPLRRLVVHTSEMWPGGTNYVIEQLAPLCDAHAMVQLRLEGELTRRQYHQLDLNQIRRYGEEHCFALAIDDSALSLVAEVEPRFIEDYSDDVNATQDAWGTVESDVAAENWGRISLREELVTLADEWIAAAQNEQEKIALQATKEELLAALDEGKERMK